QLVDGYSRMTPQAGRQIVMPDLDERRQHKSAGHSISIEWLKNRNIPPPSDVTTPAIGGRQLHMDRETGRDTETFCPHVQWLAFWEIRLRSHVSSFANPERSDELLCMRRKLSP